MSSSKPAGSIHDFTVNVGGPRGLCFLSMPWEMMWILAFTMGRSC
ncbi:unnamed protein product [Musa acuminata var. zebrina]